MAGVTSGKGGSRREDVAARRLIEQNRGTIERLADQLSGGAYSARHKPPEAPQASGSIIHVLGGRPTSDVPSPYVRVSPNERVILVDRETGRQLDFLGQIRRVGGQRSFFLATKANGFFAEVDAELGAALVELDGRPLGPGYDEDHLTADIRQRLGVA